MSDFQVRKLTGATFGPTNGKTALHDVIPAEWQGGHTNGKLSESAIMGDWSGGRGDLAGKRLYVRGGGHGDGANNGLYYYDFNGPSKPTGWVLAPNSLSTVANIRPASGTREGFPLMFDNYPPSVHSYDQAHFDPVLNRYYAISGSQWSSGNGALTSYFDLTANQWSTVSAPAGWATVPGVTRFGGTVLGKADGTKLLWIDGDYPNQVAFITSAGAVTMAACTMRRNSTGAGVCSVNIGGDNWMTLSVESGSTYLYTHVLNWAASTITSTQRTHASHASTLSGGNSSGGSLIYDAALNCVWAFGLVRHFTASTMAMEIIKISLVDYSAAAYTLTGDSIAGDEITTAQGSYNRHIWFPQWRIVGTVQSYNQPMSIIKLPG